MNSRRILPRAKGDDHRQGSCILRGSRRSSVGVATLVARAALPFLLPSFNQTLGVRCRKCSGNWPLSAFSARRRPVVVPTRARLGRSQHTAASTRHPPRRQQVVTSPRLARLARHPEPPVRRPCPVRQRLPHPRRPTPRRRPTRHLARSRLSSRAQRSLQ
jgi:hypothetical protein